MKSYRIPFNKPGLAGPELAYISEVIERGHSAGDGHFTARCRQLLEYAMPAPSVLLTTSCTHALEMAAMLLDIQPGDEVIVPSFTFVSTANAFVRSGAKPVFADICPQTLNLDPSSLDSLITDRTRAVIPVHYAGVGCEMDMILAIAGRTGIDVIEDNAHGLFGTYRGRALGTFGVLSTLSFHETKNLICGEGGALIVNDPSYAHRAEIIREKGTNRGLFLKGMVNKYTWVDAGSSFLPSDILAAFLYAQLEAREQILAKRRRVWEYYARHLASWAAANHVRLPHIPPHCTHPYHMFYLLLPDEESREDLRCRLEQEGILSVFHYLPLHSSEMARRFGLKQECPVTDQVSRSILRLPFYNDLTEAEQEQVVEAILRFRPGGPR